MSDAKTTTSRLKKLREDNNLTKKALTEQVNISINTITNVESGKNKLSIEIALEIAEKYGVSLDWLYGLSDDKEVDSLDKLMSFFKIGKKAINVENTNTVLTKEFLTIELSKVASSYFCELSEIEKIAVEKELPEEAYIAWKEAVKKKYENSLRENNSEIIKYILLESTDEFANDLFYVTARKKLSSLEAKIELDKLNIE